MLFSLTVFRENV